MLSLHPLVRDPVWILRLLVDFAHLVLQIGVAVVSQVPLVEVLHRVVVSSDFLVLYECINQLAPGLIIALSNDGYILELSLILPENGYGLLQEILLYVYNVLIGLHLIVFFIFINLFESVSIFFNYLNWSLLGH